MKIVEFIIKNESFDKFGFDSQMVEKIEKYTLENTPTLIDVTGMRGIGKTYGLYEIAHHFNGIVLVGSKGSASGFNRLYDTNIFFYYNSEGIKWSNKRVFVDEDVPICSLSKNIRDRIAVGLVSRFKDSLEIDNEGNVLFYDHVDETKNETSFRDNIIKSLKENAKNLTKQIEIKTNKEDVGTVKNLIQALGCTLRLIDEYEYKLMYSEYQTEVDGKFQEQVAIWEQNIDGVVKNHKMWNVKSKTIYCDTNATPIHTNIVLNEEDLRN